MKLKPGVVATHGPIKPEPQGRTLYSERKPWSEVWMEMAETMGARSKCSRAKIGCVIVGEDQTVISAAYNGPPPGYHVADGDNTRCKDWCPRAQPGADHGNNYDNCVSNHAEANAVVRADWRRLRHATVYVNGSVCFSCAKLLAAAQVSQIVHIVNDESMHRYPDAVEKFLDDCSVIVFRISSPQDRIDFELG